jgi:hypothetical protein
LEACTALDTDPLLPVVTEAWVVLVLLPLLPLLPDEPLDDPSPAAGW